MTEETNFRIEPLPGGGFAVRSDSNRFGKQDIVFEDFDRSGCLRYIESRQDTPEPSFYIIKDLSSWVREDAVSSEVNRFDGLEEAIAHFKASPAVPDRSIPAGMTTLTLGASIEGRDMDILHVRGGHNHLVKDFMRFSRFNTNHRFLGALRQIHRELGFADLTAATVQGYEFSDR